MVNTRRNYMIEQFQKRGILRGLGYYLDCTEDWNIVLEMSEDVEEQILDLRNQGFNRFDVEQMLDEEHRKYVGFIYMYHV